MSVQQESPAVKLAISHAEAWSNHNWELAQSMLAPDVHVTTASTQTFVEPTDLSGVEQYMTGLLKFGQTVEPGSAQVVASVGDDHTSLILLNVRATLGPNGPKATIPAARLAFFDENQKLKEERVVFFAIPDSF